MRKTQSNKKKIINDPVHGFISISHNLLHDIIEHPYFQRLRRIKQLGLTHLVYPGAMHTRFHHAIGAMFLMEEALNNLKAKKHHLDRSEEKAAKAAILMHDIGHGPFSHALEHSIVDHISHEDISLMMMEKINEDFNGKLDKAIKIFKGNYSRKFLNQLISSQLDVDRMDYLRRDSFYSGVLEGVTGTQRIIKMLDVKEDRLVVEYKGIYSIDNFLNSRRIMYWQVYMHKTVLAAENMLINVLKRARDLATHGTDLFATPALQFFLYQSIGKDDFTLSDTPLRQFAALDDFDILSAIKVWAHHNDPVIAELSQGIIHRKLLKVELDYKPFDENRMQALKDRFREMRPYLANFTDYFIFSGVAENHFYDFRKNNINVLMPDGSIKDISEVSEQWSSGKASFGAEKHFICYPEYLR